MKPDSCLKAFLTNQSAAKYDFWPIFSSVKWVYITFFFHYSGITWANFWDNSLFKKNIKNSWAVAWLSYSGCDCNTALCRVCCVLKFIFVHVCFALYCTVHFIYFMVRFSPDGLQQTQRLQLKISKRLEVICQRALQPGFKSTPIPKSRLLLPSDSRSLLHTPTKRS